MKKIKDFITEYIPKTTLAALILAVISALVLVLSVSITAFADAVNSTASAAFRLFMSLFTVWLPFSVFEIFLLSLPLLIALAIILTVRFVKIKRSALRFLFLVLSLPAFIFSGFVFALGVPYHTTALSEQMQLPETEICAETLSATAVYLRNETNALAKELGLSSESESQMNMSMTELSDRLTDAYEVFAESYGFPFNFYTRAKPMIFDGVMSSSHLLGIYTFFTGESNINDGYPDYTLPFTVAHEFAHQRGIIREDEANFLAFVICTSSDDPYIRYSGFLNMYEYTVSALYKTDRRLFKEVHSELSLAAFADIRAAGEHSEKYESSKLGQTVSNVNDAYLQMNGTPGSISYSLCVRLTVAYYHEML